MTQLKTMNREQKKAAQAAVAFLKKDGKAFVQSATGTGKSRIILNTIKLVNRDLSDKPVLVLAHRNALVDQLTLMFKHHGINVTRFCADEKDLNGSVVVSSIPTLSRKENLEGINANKFALVILDEAHHAPADSFHNTLNYFNAMKLGVSATPFRPDKMQEERNHFGEIVYELSYEEAKELKIVAKERAFLILTDSVINGVTTATGEYTKRTLERLYTTKNRNDVIIRSYLKYGRGTMDKKGLNYKSICFCINTKHAMRMSELFNKKGIKAAFLVSDRRYLSVAERDETMKRFKDTHEIEMLCVVDIFNEGVDVPDLCCALMARPTRSNIIYQQQVGRVCRRIEREKHDFVILDYVDNTTREFTCYTADNNFKKKATKKNIVTEYLMVQDPVVVRKRVTDVMASVRKFEEQFLKTREQTVEEIKNFFLKNQRLPICTNDTERKLYQRMLNTARKCPDFRKWCRAKGLFFDKQSHLKNLIKILWKKKKRLPRKCEESALNAFLKRRCDPKNKNYDPKLHGWAEKRGLNSYKETVGLPFKKLKEFYNTNKRLPVKKTEPKLYQSMMNMIARSSRTFKQEVLDWAMKRGHVPKK